MTLDTTSPADIERTFDPHQFFSTNRRFILKINEVNTVKAVGNAKFITLKPPDNKLRIDTGILHTSDIKKIAG